MKNTSTLSNALNMLKKIKELVLAKISPETFIASYNYVKIFLRKFSVLMTDVYVPD